MKSFKTILITIFIMVGTMVFTQTYSITNYKNSTSTDSLMVSVTSVNTTDINSTDGYVKLQITGGIPPYSTSLISATMDSVKQFQGSVIELNNLRMGGYIFIVQDSLGSYNGQSIIIDKK